MRDLRGGRRDKEAGAGRDSAIPEDFGGDVQIARLRSRAGPWATERNRPS